MKISKRKKVENSGQVALKCRRIRSQLQRPTVKSVSASRPVIARETLGVTKVRTRTFPVAETDGEVSLRFQASTCPRDLKGLVRERGQRDGSACAKKGGVSDIA